ncbi:hypothetical protein [Halosegnis marinus]|uniref:hypothetical protein n=1 Tax=Halosegnis marinus TaxID=3034023 RepID=UPI0036116F1C
MLNSAIYTHNLASRYDGGGDDATTFARDARAGAGAALDHANGAGGSYAAVEGNYSEAIGNVSEAFGRSAAVSGRLVSIDHLSESRGVRVVDDEPGGSDFRPANGSASSWYVATDATVRNFEMTVDRTSLDDLGDSFDLGSLFGLFGGSETPFTVRFEDGTDTYLVAVYADEADDEVKVQVYEGDDGSGTEVGTCSVVADTATVEYAAARVNGERCAPLEALDDLGGSLDVRYDYPDSAVGSYELVADRLVAGEDAVGPFVSAVNDRNFGYGCTDGGSVFNGTADPGPHAVPALYDTTVETTYESADATFTSEWRVAPDERTVPTAPRIESFVVNDGTSGDDQFDLSWSATDPNGDPVSVEVTFVDSDGDTETFTAPGTVTLPTALQGDGPYDVTITATAGGESRSVSERHADDGTSGPVGCPT